MNTGIESGAAPLYDASHGFGALAPLILMAVFTVGGLVLLYAAYRVFRKAHDRRHHRRDRYTVHRH
jgi:hypothetical protein